MTLSQKFIHKMMYSLSKLYKPNILNHFDMVQINIFYIHYKITCRALWKKNANKILKHSKEHSVNSVVFMEWGSHKTMFMMLVLLEVN